MSIERLSFSSEEQYQAIELAIHLNRYSIVRHICKGLNVLDLACGEGYGSFAMASLWAANSVVGVDVSEEAIENAKKEFSHPQIDFICLDAEKINQTFEPESFDLIVSLETIEHVAEQEKFLLAIKKLIKPNGIIVISCPNDHWYYGSGESKNPFHLRTYYFDEFKEQLESILGHAQHFLFGRPITGMGNFIDLPNQNGNIKENFRNLKTHSTYQISTDDSISPQNCSYFVGIWANSPIKQNIIESSVFYSTSMDKSSEILFEENKRMESNLNWLKGKITDLENRNDELESSVRENDNRINVKDSRIKELESALIEIDNRINEKDNFIESLQTNLKQKTAEIQESQTELNLTNTQLNSVQNQLNDIKNDLQSKLNTICLMEKSKFWKARDLYFRIKKIVTKKQS